MSKDKRPFNILVVEDNPGDFLIIEHLLRERISSPVIMHALNFEQASACLSVQHATVDVILLDINLPDKSGQELIAEMLLIASSCPIVILTGFEDMDFSIQSIVQGISDYLFKDDLNAIALYKSIIYSFERKKIISLLKGSEKRFSDLFHLSPQPMWVFNQDSFRFVQVNKAATELYGYTEAEFLDMSLMEIKLAEDIAEAKEYIRNRNYKDGVFKKATLHRKKSGEIIEVEIYSTRIFINNKALISVIVNDVTEKNRHEHNMIKAIIKTQEDERYEIGGELHDNVCQILAASQLKLGMLKHTLVPADTVLFNECVGNIGLALTEIRNLSHRLAPAFFDDSAIEDSFRRLFDTFNIDDKLEILLHVDKRFHEFSLEFDLQLNLYRVLQEQLRNILKYAQATLIEVDLLIHNDKLKMRIADDGIGFDISKAKTGIGLANMKRRVELFSGKFEICSSPGDGCEVLIEIPLVGKHIGGL